MADVYVSTNKLPQNPYPEQNNLILEGEVFFESSDYNESGGDYFASKDVRLTDLIQLGNRLKGFPPTCLKVEAWLNQTTVIGGDINDNMHPLPFDGFIRATISDVGNLKATFRIQNSAIVHDGLVESFLILTSQLSFNPATTNFVPGYNLSYVYKIYSTIYRFRDPLEG